MVNKNDDDDLDGISGDYHGGPDVIREEQGHEIYGKMSDWTSDMYGKKTKPNFETWIKSLTDKEFKVFYKLINKK